MSREPSNRETHETLEGGQGKDSYYRADRFPVPELIGGLDLEFAVSWIGGTSNVVDYSINGVAFAIQSAVEEEPPLQKGVFLDDFQVSFGGTVVYAGRALVRHVSLKERHWKIGVNLQDDVLDMDRVYDIRNMAQIRAAIGDAEAILAPDAVTHEYKEAVAELAFVLERFKTILDAQEKQLEGLDPAERSRQGDRILFAVEPAFQDLYRPILLRLNKLIEPHGLRTPRAYRKFTEAVMHPLILGAPGYWQCYTKPRKYAGDYVAMLHCMQDKRLGDTLYDKLTHRMGRDQPLAQSVLHRKDYLREKIQQVVRRGLDTVRILSLACGPALEIAEFAERYTSGPRVEITLIDQDNQALSYANRTISRAAATKRASLRFKYRYLAFAQLNDPKVFESIPRQNLLYVSGLFDYLRSDTCQALAAALFELLQPGGELVMGNMRAPVDSRWTPSYMLDWQLRYRTEEQMLALAEKIPASVSEVALEQVSHYYVLTVKRTS
jgi:extracellular factor (EF) 3-hydroxypalmitic acid methyl ester biosynthesis protein